MIEPAIVAQGLRFPEGPVWRPDGSVLLVEMERGTVSSVSPDGSVTVVAETGGGPNGLAIGPDGKGYVCNNGGFLWKDINGQPMPMGRPETVPPGTIQRVDLSTGAVETLYDACDGIPLKAPNDIVFDADGDFWFTDSGLMTATGLLYGGLYHARSDGSAIRLVRGHAVGFNGTGFSPDGKTLYVTETMAGRLWAFDITGPGEVAPAPMPFMPGRIVQTLPLFQIVDSLAVEASGKICVGTAINGGITVFDPDGTTEHIPLPDSFVSNICFGAADMCDAWITGASSGNLFKLRWPRPGLPLAFD